MPSSGCATIAEAMKWLCVAVIFKAFRKQFGAWQVYDVTNDLAEENDIAKEHPEFLKTIIEDGKAWSDTHIDPQWHDTAAGIKSWEERSMPQYERTFQMR